MLPVSLDCLFLISVFSNVYLIMELICIMSVHRMGVIDGARKKTRNSKICIAVLLEHQLLVYNILLFQWIHATVIHA